MRKTRFAPSPTGELHMGHLASALWVWAGARIYDAKVVLRIEDHDRQRSKPIWEDQIKTILERFGFSWDFGPNDLSVTSNFRQSNRLERYQEILQLLVQQDLVFGCSCSRSQLSHESKGPGGETIYSGLCVGNPLRHGCGVRISVPKLQFVDFTDLWLGEIQQNVYHEAGMFLLRDRVGNWTYQFCCAIDDLDQGIDLVIRGQDLLYSTARQVYIRQIIDPKSPPTLFAHHPLLCDPTGRKLSKSDQDLSLAEMLSCGKSTEQILAECLKLMGLDPKEKSLCFAEALEIVGQKFKTRL